MLNKLLWPRRWSRFSTSQRVGDIISVFPSPHVKVFAGKILNLTLPQMHQLLRVCDKEMHSMVNYDTV